MFIENTELFKDLGDDVMNEIAKIMTEESYDKGDVIFTQTQPAKDFYILVNGRVRLTLGGEAEIEYTVTKSGEVFGWSGMLDRKYYTARAECAGPTKLVKIEKDKLNRIFAKHPENGMTFFKKLAGAVFQRLIYNYEAFLSEGSLRGVTSFGTGQVSDTRED